MKLELFTRPMWLDCKAAKEFLSRQNIAYKEIDFSKHPEEEESLIRISGTRIVPTFVFKQKRLLMPSKKKILIGFEQNRAETEEILLR